MAQDPQNQYYQDNSQYNPQGYNPNLVTQNNYNQGQVSLDQNATYQYPVDGSGSLQPVAQTYDPNQYYQPQPVAQGTPDYQYQQTQPAVYPIDNSQNQYQNQQYSQPDPYAQTYQYQNPEINQQPITNYNPVTNSFDPVGSNYENQIPLVDSTLPPVQNFDYGQTSDFNSPPVDQFQQGQYNNFDPNYDSEKQFDPNNTEPTVHQSSFFSNKRNLVIIGLIVLMIGLISASGILFYLRSQESNTTPQTSTSSIVPAITTANPNPNTLQTTTSSTNTKTTIGVSSQAGRAVAVGTNDSGGPGTPATNSKKTNVTKLPIEWLKSKFTPENLNEDGSCKIVSVCGEKADFDNDGLLNIEEYNFLTDPLNPDTDGDGLSDGDEIKVYYTDPTKKDSDNDTYEDGDEVTNCYDPITATNSKLSAARKSQITSIATTVPLHKTTIDKLKKAGATNDDIDKGFVQIKCGTSTSTNITSSSTPVVKPTKNNS